MKIEFIKRGNFFKKKDHNWKRFACIVRGRLKVRLNEHEPIDPEKEKKNNFNPFTNSYTYRSKSSFGINFHAGHDDQEKVFDTSSEFKRRETALIQNHLKETMSKLGTGTEKINEIQLNNSSSALAVKMICKFFL